MIDSRPVRLLRRLTSPLDPDAYLSLLNPRWGTRLRGVIESVTPLTGDAAAIRIRPGVGWAGHSAGQFVTIGVDVDGVRHHRCYSLTAPEVPTGTARGGRIEIAVQATAAGVVSNHLVRHARPGDVVQLTQAEGDFVLPADPGRLLFISGGSGVTPVIGMLRSLARRHDDGEGQRASHDVVVLHHATQPDRDLFAAELALLAGRSPWLRVDTSYTRCGDARLDAARLESLCPDWAERDAFACGPATLLDFATDHWGERGQLERLRLERFVPAPRHPAPPEHDPSHSIAHFASAGIDVLADAATPLLEIAEDAGLAPPSGCRMGICRTCTTRLDAGCVRDLRDGRVASAGQHVQLCVSAAVTDVALDL